jgi:hypothetical protein
MHAWGSWKDKILQNNPYTENDLAENIMCTGSSILQQGLQKL